MLKNILIIFPLVAAAYGSGQLAILRNTCGLELPQNDEVSAQNVGNLMSGCLGLSTMASVPTNIKIGSPFNVCDKIVMVFLDSSKPIKLENFKPVSNIKIIGDDVSLSALDENLLMYGLASSDLHSEQGIKGASDFSELCETQIKPDASKVSELKPEKSVEDKQCYEHFNFIHALNGASKCNFNPVTKIHVNLNDMEPAALHKCVKLLEKEISQLAVQSTGDKSMFALITNGNGLRELKRSRRAADDVKDDDLNLAKSYSEDYPVIFNIILWFGVVLAFSLLAISYAIATMDPGRDSIIYRMTSTRIKKDN